MKASLVSLGCIMYRGSIGSGEGGQSPAKERAEA